MTCLNLKTFHKGHLVDWCLEQEFFIQLEGIFRSLAFPFVPVVRNLDNRFLLKALGETSGTASHAVNRADNNRAAQQRRGQTIAQFLDW
jgi:hypothetical protein